MRKLQASQYNTAPNKSRININLGAHLLSSVDTYREDLAFISGLPKVSRSVAITHLLTKAKQGGLFNELA